MWRRTTTRLDVRVLNTQGADKPLEITTPYSLLRVLLRMIDRKVKSGHARNFFHKKVISEWRLHRNCVDPGLQKLHLERAGAMLTALMIPAGHKAGDPFVWDFSDSRNRSGNTADATKARLIDDTKPLIPPPGSTKVLPEID
jgi:hypothetical protein